MTIPSPRLGFAKTDAPARPLYLTTPEAFEGLLAQLSPLHRAWVSAQGFNGATGALVLLPAADGQIEGAIFGLGDAKARARSRFTLARAASTLPEGAWRLEGDLSPEDADEAALGWLLAGYRFDRYKSATRPQAQLVAPKGVDAARIEAIANAEALTRDLVNTPSWDMGPDELEAAARDLAAEFGASVTVITGEDLLAQNFPMIHAVGRASTRAPRLIDMTWGTQGPTLTLVGKGVCFDTGGLDLKPSSGMLNMKKDMGGAATTLGLARMIMETKANVRLRVLIPAVENMVAGNAMRPRDILTSRKGLTVEVNNTDAEGRLVLADALAFGAEANPDLMISMATLTGAARVALGADIPPFYTEDDALAARLAQSATRVRDPLWRMPLWDAYDPQIEPGIADLDNAPSGGMAGSITAALFLRRFAEGTRYAHFDIFCLQLADAPARPKGGVGQGARAIFDALPDLLKA